MLRGSLLCPSPSRQGRPPAPQPCVRGAPSHPIRHLPLITSQEWRLLFSLPSQVALGCISSLVAGWSHLPPEKHSTPWHWQRRGEGNEKPQLWVAFSPQRDWTKSPTSSSLLQSWWSFRDQFQTGRGRTTFKLLWHTVGAWQRDANSTTKGTSSEKRKTSTLRGRRGKVSYKTSHVLSYFWHVFKRFGLKLISGVERLSWEMSMSV